MSTINPLEDVPADDSTRWLKDAVMKRAVKIIVCYDIYNHTFYPYYLLQGEKEEEVVKQINRKYLDRVEGVLDLVNN